MLSLVGRLGIGEHLGHGLGEVIQGSVRVHRRVRSDLGAVESADITYVSTWQGWLYAAFILDVHSRMIVGWQLANHMRTDLVLDALEMALWRRDLTYGDLTHHSDRGSPNISASATRIGSPR